jgi:Zincin-like metallopeptidase
VSSLYIWRVGTSNAAGGEAVVTAPRLGSTRDLRGRGLRGPVWLTGPLSPRAAELRPTRREVFDELVLSAVDRLTARVGDALASVEFGSEDVPALSDDWTEPVPLGSLVPASADRPVRIVVFRRPVEMRAKSPAERSLLVHTQLTEHVAALLGCDPADLDD